ncbi:MAG: DUF5011 domain-containing protein [bacterium]|nr:DUF5011 domain-containing protein [bacterium]
MIKETFNVKKTNIKTKTNNEATFEAESRLVKAAKHMSLKLLALSLVISLNIIGLPGIGDTMGYYLDIESSTENTFIAGSVDFSLGISGWQATSTAVSMPPGDIVKKEVTVDPLDSNPFQYFATTTNITGDSDFCDALLVTANLEGNQMYDGPLTGLLTATTTTLDSWDFTYTTGVNDFQNRVCDFDIDYNAWQTRHDYPTYEDGGYNDTEKVSNHLSSWGFRINKVYYDVKTPERGEEGVNEWVEIYNQTNTAIDISGWEICDNTGCDTLPSTPAIPAQKYAVIVATSTTATTTTVSSGLPAYWYLPSEVTQINIDNLIGNGLANDADMLVLKRPDGVIVDQMNWGTPDSGWANYNSNVWNPGAIDVAEGNVLARVPSGYDTDAPSDWVELLPPTVDLIYPDEGGSYTWYWGYSYNITWTATNNNGSDTDLDIGIFYVKDVNHDSVISVGDTTHTIIATTANDGLFNWTVPSGFLGYIWIHLVATGPENPMLNTGTVSGKIYDPIALFLTEEGTDMEDVDLEAPVITVQGNNPATITIGATYNDLGALVTDNVNNNLGIVTEGATIDTTQTGVYTVTYSATDQAGNVGSATRTVIVYDPADGEPDLSAYQQSTDTSDTSETTEVIAENSVLLPTEEITTGGGNTTTETPEVVAETAIEEEQTNEEVIEETTPVVEEQVEVVAEVTEEVAEEVTEEITEEVTTEEVTVVTEESPVLEEETVNEGETTEQVAEEPVAEDVVVAESESTPIVEEAVIPEPITVVEEIVDSEPQQPEVSEPSTEAVVPEPLTEVSE